jgi:hypothetical protein
VAPIVVSVLKYEKHETKCVCIANVFKAVYCILSHISSCAAGESLKALTTRFACMALFVSNTTKGQNAFLQRPTKDRTIFKFSLYELHFAQPSLGLHTFNFCNDRNPNPSAAFTCDPSEPTALGLSC